VHRRLGHGLLAKSIWRAWRQEFEISKHGVANEMAMEEKKPWKGLQFAILKLQRMCSELRRSTS
jgi:hypothetical protein